MKLEKIRVIQVWVLILTCILFLVGIGLTYPETEKREHNPENIKIKIVDSEAKIQSGSYSQKYRVYMDLEIENKTKVALRGVSVTFYFKNKSGKLIGSMNSTLGNGAKKIETNKKEIFTSYLEESGGNWDALFTELYENGLKNCDVSYEVTGAIWDDGYSYYGT